VVGHRAPVALPTTTASQTGILLECDLSRLVLVLGSRLSAQWMKGKILVGTLQISPTIKEHGLFYPIGKFWSTWVVGQISTLP